MYRANAFRQGLRQLGYAEGKDFVVEERFADGKLDRLNELAAELVRLKVDVIVTTGGTPTRAAKAATATIPIVATGDPGPIRQAQLHVKTPCPQVVPKISTKLLLFQETLARGGGGVYWTLGKYARDGGADTLSSTGHVRLATKQHKSIESNRALERNFKSENKSNRILDSGISVWMYDVLKIRLNCQMRAELS